MTFKTFGTLTRSSPFVALQFQKFQSAGAVTTQPVNWQTPISLPAEFDGRVAWRNYLSPIRNQGKCGSCFAYATVDCLTDRYNLYTLGQMRPHVLSADSLTICMYTAIRDATDYQKAFQDMQTASQFSQEALRNDACHGSSLYEAARFCYFQGVPYESCVGENTAMLERKLQDYTDATPLPTCEQLQGLDHTHCSDQKTAMRVFRCRTFAAIAGVPEDGGSIDLLKFVLYRFGPIASGFDVYSDFLNTYDGKSVYAHVSKAGEKPLGGHAVRIVGWDREGWIIGNSWGTEWGDHGYFRMKYNTCNLEKNVVVTAPDIEGYNIPDSEFAKILLSSAEQHIKDTYVIDLVTRYPIAALKKIATGELRGDLTPVFDNQYALWRKEGLFLAARDVPETPPTITRLPPVSLHVLLSKYQIAWPKSYYWRITALWFMICFTFIWWQSR